MNWRSQKAPLWLNRFIVAFSLIGLTLGVATLLLVYWIMSKFRIELREHVMASGDPARIATLEQGLREEQLVSFGILAAIVLVAALNICAGFEMLRQDQARR